MEQSIQQHWMQYAVALAVRNVETARGGPFAAVVVKDGKLVAEGANSVTRTNDPTAHAEVMAIRTACQALESFQLTGCELYTSCEPCPMCLGAIYWARPERYYFCATRLDAAGTGFDDELIYSELLLEPEQRIIPGYALLHQAAMLPFDAWRNNQGKIQY